VTVNLLGKARRFVHALDSTRRTKGTAAAVRLTAMLATEIMMRPLTRRQDVLLDQRLGVGTLRTAAELSSHPDGVAYSPTPANQFRRILRRLPVPEPGEFTFVDLGCGKGRTLLLAAEHGFGRVVGVEFDADLAAAARRNVAAYERVAPSRTGVIDVVAADAACYDFPLDPVVVFLFNPFGQATLRAVADRIEETLGRWPRPFVVAYFNPMHAEVLDGCVSLRAVSRNARWSIYASHVPA
jgi:SAM-dependent methyltransferase